jgi:hypothetical protein
MRQRGRILRVDERLQVRPWREKATDGSRRFAVGVSVKTWGYRPDPDMRTTMRRCCIALVIVGPGETSNGAAPNLFFDQLT